MTSELACGVRDVAASDGTSLPIPYGLIGFYDEYGRPLEISETAEVSAVPQGSGYYVAVNSAAPENSEAQELFTNVSAESMTYLAERVLLQGATQAIRLGQSVAGILADVLTTSKLTRQTFIKADFDGVPVTYCILT